MQMFLSTRLSLIFVPLTLALMLGCGSTEGGLNGEGGNGATGGSGGTGGTPGVLVALPQCVSSAYQIVFRAFMEPMDPLLKYMDTPAGLRDAAQKPPIVSLTEDQTVDSTDPAAITGTVGGLPPADCTIDLETFEVRC